MPTIDEGEDVALGYSTIFARTWYLIDINTLRLGDVSNSWSRQGFSTSSCILITWRRCCDFIFNDVLSLNYGWLKRLGSLHR